MLKQVADRGTRVKRDADQEIARPIAVDSRRSDGAPLTPSADRHRVRSVAKATSILLLIATQRKPMTARMIGEQLAIPVPTAYHLLETLVQDEMLVKDSAKAYDLGPNVGVLADAFLGKLTPPEYLVVPLHELARRTKETVYVSTWREDDAVIVAMLEGTRALRVTGLHSGTRGYVHARAAGKLFLAFAPAETVDRYLAIHELVARTPQTITDPKVLREELLRIRKRGYALDCEEFSEGVTGISAPVLRQNTVLAAYTLSAPTQRFAIHQDDYVSAVLDTAAAVARSSPTADTVDSHGA